MTTATRPRAWWQTAPNPPCPAPWCERTHEPDEFTAGGSLFCVRSIAETTAYTVEVQQCTFTNDAGDGYEVDAPTLWLATSKDELTAKEAVNLAAALARAAIMLEAGATR